MANALGIIGLEGSQDREGQRTYHVDWLVESELDDGPVDLMFASGVAVIGAPFTYGNTNDPWAFCTPELKVEPYINPNEMAYLWKLRQTFSTTPLSRCQNQSIDNPLNEPYKVSGTFVKYTKEATKDKDGAALMTSSLEVVRGKAAERDFNRPTVVIERNVLMNPLSTFVQYIDHVNDSPLWGLGPRKVKLSNVTWERHLYARCTFYYSVRYDFDVDWQTFDRVILDEGTRVLQGHSPGTSLPQLDPDAIDPETNKAYRLNAKNFEAYKDLNGNNAKVILDGKGRPWDGEDKPGTVSIKLYNEANLGVLGLPATL
jgi:hypothetical protein